MGVLETERDRYADEGKSPMAWERYLELAPALSGIEVDAREEVLAARELDGDTWARAEGYWTLALALELREGRTERADSYGKACAEAFQARGRAEHAVEPTLPEAGALLPSRPAVSPASPSVPASPPGSAPLPALIAAPEVEVPTFLRAAEAPRAPGRVFVAIAVPSPAPLPAPAPDTTSDALPAYRAAPLPFGQTPSPAYAARLATTPSVHASAAPSRPDATVIASITVAEPVLPFVTERASPKPPVKLPDLTLERHAALSAELAADFDPARRAAILARYGIESHEALSAAGAHWQARLAAEPHAAQQWKAAYAENRTRLQQESRRVR